MLRFDFAGVRVLLSWVNKFSFGSRDFIDEDLWASLGLGEFLFELVKLFFSEALFL